MKTTGIYILTGLGFILGVLLFPSCRKNPTAPQPKVFNYGPATTIQQLRNSFLGLTIHFGSNNTILTAVVTCDENSGNLYKQVYVRDHSGIFSATNNYGALSLHFVHTTQGVLSVGDSIAINLNGAILAKSSGGSLEIDSLTTQNIAHLKTGLNPQPLMVTLPQLNTYSNVTGGGFIYDGQLVQLNNVEFISGNVGTTYAVPQAPPAPPLNVNKFINDFTGNTIVAYNSGYANFAGNMIPANSGTVIAMANLYTTMQLTLRSVINGDLVLSNAYNPIVYDTITQNFSCAALSSKAAITTAGWQTIAYKGSLNWLGGQYGTLNSNPNPTNWKYAPVASNYKTNDVQNDMWLISPPIIDHGGSITKYMDFSTAVQYGTNIRLLSVLVSRTFDGTHLDPGQWQDISGDYLGIPTTGNNGYPSFVYANSTPGSPSFSSNPKGLAISGSSPTFYIAFRYQSSTNVNYPDSTGASYYIGTLVLRNN